MTEKELKYADSIYVKLRKILNQIDSTYSLEYENKEIVLEDMKSMIDDSIRELHSEDLYW